CQYPPDHLPSGRRPRTVAAEAAGVSRDNGTAGFVSPSDTLYDSPVGLRLTVRTAACDEGPGTQAVPNVFSRSRRSATLSGVTCASLAPAQQPSTPAFHLPVELSSY